MLMMKSSLVVRFVRKANRFQAIVEQVQGMHLSRQQLAHFSVEGATLGDAYDSFKLIVQGLQRRREMSRDVAITFKYLVHQPRKLAYSVQEQ